MVVKNLKFSRDFDFTDLAKTIGALPSKVLAAGGPALYEEAEEIMAQSKEIVPVLTGALRASGRVVDPKYEGNRVSVVLGYGGFAAGMTGLKPSTKGGFTQFRAIRPTQNYAIVQHEDLTFNHTGGRRAKYLQEPLVGALFGMDQRLRNRIRARLKVK